MGSQVRKQVPGLPDDVCLTPPVRCEECGCTKFGAVDEWGAWFRDWGAVTVTVYQCVLCGHRDEVVRYG